MFKLNNKHIKRTVRQLKAMSREACGGWIREGGSTSSSPCLGSRLALGRIKEEQSFACSRHLVFEEGSPWLAELSDH